MKLLRTVGFSLLFFIGALTITLAFAATLFGIPGTDLRAVALLLLVVGGASGMLALLLMQPAVLGRIGGVRGQLVGVGLICGLLLVGMMLAGAQAMFISGHDLSVLLTMLLFAALSITGCSREMPPPAALEQTWSEQAAAVVAGGRVCPVGEVPGWTRAAPRRAP